MDDLRPSTHSSATRPASTSLAIAGITIRVDVAGRYCLNDLHRASGGNPSHRPGEWLRNKQSQALMTELGGAGNSAGPMVTVNDGINNGTYVAKELVYAYAMWISPAFNLKVIRAYDAMVTSPAVDPMQALNDPATMRELLLGYTEKVLMLESRVGDLAPKAAALDMISASDEDLTITQAAKVLSIKRETLTNWMHQHGWVYRQNGSWVAYQQHVQNGRLQYKEAHYTDEKTQQACIRPYCHITPKGLAKLALVFGQEKVAA